MGKIADLKAKYEPFYKGLGSVYCPILKADIVFGNTGWKHIRFTSQGVRRKPADIAMRFKLVTYIPHVVKTATTVVKEDGKLKNGNKITFYEMSEVVTLNGIKKHVTVIISQVENGKLHYLSVRYAKAKKQKSP